MSTGICHETLTLPSHLRNAKHPIRNSPPNLSAGRRRNWSRFNSRSMVAKFPAKNLIIGEVKILKRGEPLGKSHNQLTTVKENRKPRILMNKKKEKHDADLLLGSTDRLGPEPETVVKKQIRVEKFNNNKILYPGSAAVESPPPSSLPVPGFLGEKSAGEATSDLRRLLRLDLV